MGGAFALPGATASKNASRSSSKTLSPQWSANAFKANCRVSWGANLHEQCLVKLFPGHILSSQEGVEREIVVAQPVLKVASCLLQGNAVHQIAYLALEAFRKFVARKNLRRMHEIGLVALPNAFAHVRTQVVQGLDAGLDRSRPFVVHGRGLGSHNALDSDHGLELFHDGLGRLRRVRGAAPRTR